MRLGLYLRGRCFQVLAFKVSGVFSVQQFEDIAIGGKRKREIWKKKKCKPLKNIQGSQYSEMYNVLGQIILSFDC